MGFMGGWVGVVGGRGGRDGVVKNSRKFREISSDFPEVLRKFPGIFH